ncbi:MAG: tyrosine-type recombinase/integrase [Thermodesulfobacteriota bacterium]|nr:tyrosine-type recombinase/integrase [Thermodesulfobacteriota bacterium]
MQKAIRSVVKRSRIPKRATAHTFRHSFASHLLHFSISFEKTTRDAL